MYRSWTILAMAALLPLAGCKGQEAITTYKVPRPEPRAVGPDPKPEAPGKRVPARLFGAIVSHQDKTWFFRLNGPEEAITPHEKDFEAFVRSFRFRDGPEPIEWDLPKGWQRLPGDGAFRHATLRVPGDPPQEVVVSPLDRKSNEHKLHGNLERWATTFLKLRTFPEDEVAKVSRTIEVDGKKVIYVDMKGQTLVAGGAHGGAHPPIGKGVLPFTATLPRGWQVLLGGETGIIQPEQGVIFYAKRPKGEKDWPALLKTLHSKVVVPADKLTRRDVIIGDRKLDTVEFLFAEEKSEVAGFAVQFPEREAPWAFLLITDPKHMPALRKEMDRFLESLSFEKVKG